MAKVPVLMREDKVQEELTALLNSFARNDICWWCCPNGDWRPPQVGARLKRQGVRPGASDMMFVISGVFHGLELKTETGTQSESQFAFQQLLERAGGVYHIARGLREAIAVLQKLGVFRVDISSAAERRLARYDTLWTV